MPENFQDRPSAPQALALSAPVHQREPLQGRQQQRPLLLQELCQADELAAQRKPVQEFLLQDVWQTVCFQTPVKKPHE